MWAECAEEKGRFIWGVPIGEREMTLEELVVLFGILALCGGSVFVAYCSFLCGYFVDSA